MFGRFTEMTEMGKDMKREFELAICKKFVNGQNIVPPPGTTYTMLEHGDTPDFILKDNKNGKEIGLEVTSAYYNQNRAIGSWKAVRKADKGETGIFDSLGNTVNGSLIAEPDMSLASFVQYGLNRKCQNDYGRQCILIIYLYAPISDEEAITKIRKTAEIPERNPYSEIYVYLHIPFIKANYSPNAGKETFFRIYPFTNKLHNLDQNTYKQRKKQWEKGGEKVRKMTDEEVLAERHKMASRIRRREWLRKNMEA